MKIASGATRIVIITRSHAIKLAKINSLFIVIGVIRSLYKKIKRGDSISFDAERIAMHRSALTKQVRQSVTRGVRANRAEATYWYATKNEECVPVVAILLGGLVLIQKRAEPVTAERILCSRVAPHFLTDPELGRTEQFGYCGNRVRIVDFAHLGDPTVLL